MRLLDLRSAFLLPFLLLGPTLPGRHAQETQSVRLDTQDGPHVLWKGNEASIYRVTGDQIEVQRKKAPFSLPLPGLAAGPLHLSPKTPIPPRTEFRDPGRILAVSDIHGRFDALLHLLQAQGVVDAKLRWAFGRGHLVIVGDVMDRGAQVTETYWFLKALESRATAAGGRVHVILGNHEHMVLSGDCRYVNPKYARPVPGLPPTAELYGPESELGRWLRSRPVLIKIGPFAFLHGGISAECLGRAYSLERINREFRAILAGAPSPEATFLLSPSGPLWYRGLLPDTGKTLSSGEDVAKALSHLKAKAFVVGHTTLERITAFHEGKVYGIDAGLKDGNPGEAWLWDNGRLWRAMADGDRKPL